MLRARLAILVGLLVLHVCSALRLEQAACRVDRRAAVKSVATAFAGLCVGVRAADAAVMNAAETKLQVLLKERVASQEKSLGFKFEPDDIAEVEKILRNKYCGKAGLFGAMEGGTCQENVMEAVYCSSDSRFSNTAGCPVVKAPSTPQQPPKLPSLPSLPF